MSGIDYKAVRGQLGGSGGTLKPGDTLRDTVVDVKVEPNPWKEGKKRARLITQGTPGGIPINLPLLQVLADLDVQPGETVEITRGPDMPSTNGVPGRSTWTVDRITPDTPSRPSEPRTAHKSGPQW